jgi:hypothetical protein
MTSAVASSKAKSVDLPTIEEKVLEENPICSICMDTPEDRGILDCVRNQLSSFNTALWSNHCLGLNIIIMTLMTSS